MDGFQKILFPLYDNEPALDYAIGVAKESNAKLYLLHTYRFESENPPVESKNSSLKRTLDAHHWKDMQERYSAKLDKSGVQYEMLVELGFLADRILFNFREHKIDMVFLPKNNTFDEPIKERLKELNIPLTMI